MTKTDDHRDMFRTEYPKKMTKTEYYLVQFTF